MIGVIYARYSSHGIPRTVNEKKALKVSFENAMLLPSEKVSQSLIRI